MILKETIFKLDAHDDFLCKRIMNLPEKLVQDTHNTEEGLSRRLAEYRENNNEDNTVINVFEEDFDLEIIRFSGDAIEEDKSFLHKKLVDSIQELIEKLKIENIEVEQNQLKVFKHKDKVPVKQIFALYAINKVSTLANEN